MGGVDPECFPGLSPEEQRYNFYLEAGGTECFYGSLEQGRLLYEALGGVECFSGSDQKDLLLYEALGGTECFSGLSQAEREQAFFGALLEIINGGGLHPECTAIEGATGLTYVLTGADEGFYIRYRRTATNSEGTAYSWSNAIGPIVAAPPAPTYIINQGFEGAGYDNGETWVENGTPNPDYAVSPIVGSQSLKLSTTSAYTYVEISPAQADVWCYFRYRIDVSVNTALFGPQFGFSGGGAVAMMEINLNVANSVKLYAGGGLSAASATELTTATNYHVWIHYVKNGTSSLHVSPLGTKPVAVGAGVVYLTKASGAADANAILFILPAANHGEHVIDRVLVSTEEIGDNP